MDLGRTQALSLATKAVTTALGLIQSLIVIRLLGPANFGLVGLVMSIGGVIGVSQHLGIVDGAIREIAVLKKKSEIAKVFWVSHIVRQVVTIPLSLALILLSGVIATRIYGRPEITLFLQIFAAALILQGLQDVLGASLTGLKKI
jgi:Polysaccharide biosynthesis protein.